MTITITDIRAQIATELAALNQEFDEVLTTPNELMSKVIRSFLTTKGKQIRPILVILSARLFLGNDKPLPREVIKGAAAVELLHNASLIHDDVVDQSDTRHGVPTINSVWDNHIAVLVGDFFTATSLREAVETADLRIVDALGRLGRLLSTGEMDQICNARFHQTTEESYYQVISRKTASLFEACVEIGAYAVGIASDDSRLTGLRRFAHLLGLCFQIRDDIFDYYDDPSIGKPTGNDLREGKITLPLIHALKSSEDTAEKEAMSCLATSENLNDEEVCRLIDFAKRAGGIDYAFDEMRRMRGEAINLISADKRSEATPLIAIFDFIISRDN